MLITFFNIILYATYASSVPTMHTISVVVHSCLQLRLIRHEWGASFFNMGASLKNYSCCLKEQSCAGPSAPEQTNCLRAWNKSSPTYSNISLIQKIYIIDELVGHTDYNLP